jgi:hypothetical protein
MRIVPLTRGAVAIVDDADYEALSRHTWHLGSGAYGGSFYAYAWVNGVHVSMANFIIITGDGMVIDHINGATLDNRRENLRECSTKQNTWNRAKGRSLSKKSLASGSKYKGVSRRTYEGKFTTRIFWTAAIRAEGASKQYLGSFNTEQEAAQTYDTAAKQFFGPFARLNFPSDQNNVPPEAFFKPQEFSECANTLSVPAQRHSK